MIEHQVGVAAALAEAVDGALHLLAPCSTAASELATASSASLWQWMPSGGRPPRAAARVASAMARQAAAAGVAQAEQRRRRRRPRRAGTRARTRDSSRYPSKKCSASKMTSSTCRRR